MRSYKSIERPAQVLGMNLPDLGLVVGLFLAVVLAIGIAGLVVTVPRFLYLLILVVLVVLLYGLRYLAKHRPRAFCSAGFPSTGGSRAASPWDAPDRAGSRRAFRSLPFP
ncbi:hypothetical protein [Hymenobacter sp. BRD67]|uniref:hypothetical protein n=1 Tax=Hymenobacter sp. BRD67 TaxID=2675877 RepID=UPI0015678DE4|nr:hypothetical protein [Hymenobacter sp. BRD67]QKG55009.1 hypothetical protein GKZ67_21535 [Hymenobacter sp. BRD67]